MQQQSRVATRRVGVPEPIIETPAELMKKHNRVLLHALQTAHPVSYKGKQQFVHTFHCQRLGGTTETTIYLAGYPEPIPANEITLYEVQE